MTCQECLYVRVRVYIYRITREGEEEIRKKNNVPNITTSVRILFIYIYTIQNVVVCSYTLDNARTD